MRIVCPHCDARYDVPDAMLAGRTSVRCARCGREWPLEPAIAAPPADQPVLTRLETTVGPPQVGPTPSRPDPVAAPMPAPPSAAVTVEPPAIQRRTMAGGALAIDRLMAAPQPKPPASMALRLAWLGSLLLLVLAIGAAYAWRTEIMAAWPPSARLYAVLGLAGTTP